MTPQPLTDAIVAFLHGLGLRVEEATLDDTCFLPGVALREGTVVIDRERLRWPGDVLHEAGHVATCPPSRRDSLDGKLSVTPAEEMAVLAWSYAAAVHMGIDPLVVFHEGGYRGGGAQLAAHYASGLPPGGPGVPMLQWWGMTTAFPAMTHWIRTTEDPT